MKARITAGVGVLIAAGALAAAADFQAQHCQGTDESVDQRARRRTAFRYLRDVNAAEARLHQQRGTFASLVDAEATGLSRVPFGFVARLTFDRWSYAVILKDALDPCGSGFFADQDGVIYAARPITEGNLLQSGPTAAVVARP